MPKSYRRYHLTASEREQLISRLTDLLKTQEILFAYLHGSFVAEETFQDIDIAIYLEDMPSQQLLAYELKLEDELETKLKIPVDVKVLNNSPPVFAYMVIKKGIHLIVQNDQKRVDFEMRTLQNYFDILPFHRRYMQEV